MRCERWAEVRGRWRMAWLAAVLVWAWPGGALAAAAEPGPLIEVGAARVEITPDLPIMLSGYASRDKESTEVEQDLFVRALAFGSDAQGPAVMIVADVLGVPAAMADEVARRIEEAAGIPRERVAILATHTHSGPVIRREPPEDRYDEAQRDRITAYAERLVDGLYEAAMAALADREPAEVSWGIGEAGFAAHRRVLEDGRWTGFGVNPHGPVDHDVPLLRVRAPDGSLRAVLVNYACHATTDDPETNTVHGDWPGAAAEMIEDGHEGVTALIAIGCGADANPEPRRERAMVERHAANLVAEVRRMLDEPLAAVTDIPDAELRTIALPLEPGAEAREAVDYPVQVWRFGDDLAMVNLAGEVVSGYALRLKQELDGRRLWINAYANDYPGYIVTAQQLGEGGYEADSFRNRYGARHTAEVEDLIVATATDVLGEDFTIARGLALAWDGIEPAELLGDNRPRLITPEADGSLHLIADAAQPYGPRIEYMPEWRAFGWWTHRDYVAWDIEVERAGEYEVHKVWSVSEEASGRPYAVVAGDSVIRGTVKSTGVWENFETAKIGRLTLESGRQAVAVKPTGEFDGGGLMDLRELRLVPVE